MNLCGSDVVLQFWWYGPGTKSKVGNPGCLLVRILSIAAEQMITYPPTSHILATCKSEAAFSDFPISIIRISIHIKLRCQCRLQILQNASRQARAALLEFIFFAKLQKSQTERKIYNTYSRWYHLCFWFKGNFSKISFFSLLYVNINIYILYRLKVVWKPGA